MTSGKHHGKGELAQITRYAPIQRDASIWLKIGKILPLHPDLRQRGQQFGETFSKFSFVRTLEAGATHKDWAAIRTYRAEIQPSISTSRKH